MCRSTSLKRSPAWPTWHRHSITKDGGCRRNASHEDEKKSFKNRTFRHADHHFLRLQLRLPRYACHVSGLRVGKASTLAAFHNILHPPLLSMGFTSPSTLNTYFPLLHSIHPWKLKVPTIHHMLIIAWSQVPFQQNSFLSTYSIFVYSISDSPLSLIFSLRKGDLIMSRHNGWNEASRCWIEGSQFWRYLSRTRS